jgi:hypothetical protein
MEIVIAGGLHIFDRVRIMIPQERYIWTRLKSKASGIGKKSRPSDMSCAAVLVEVPQDSRPPVVE